MNDVALSLGIFEVAAADRLLVLRWTGELGGDVRGLSLSLPLLATLLESLEFSVICVGVFVAMVAGVCQSVVGERWCWCRCEHVNAGAASMKSRALSRAANVNESSEVRATVTANVAGATVGSSISFWAQLVT